MSVRFAKLSVVWRRMASVIVILAVVVGVGGAESPAQEAAAMPSDEPVVVGSDAAFAGEGIIEEVGSGAELPALRSTFSSSYATDVPGLLRMAVFDEPVNFQTPSGDWRPIDTDLVARADSAGFRSSANSTRVEVAASADAPELAAVDLGEGGRASFGLEGAAAVEPVIIGPEAMFPDALQGVDLVLEATPSGLKETLVLASSESPRVFRFPLNVEGLEAGLNEETGDVELREAPSEVSGAPGDVRLRVPAGFMVDSGTGPEGPVRSDGVYYKLIDGVAGEQVLEVTLDGAFLDDPARVWPVAVDPTFESATAPVDVDTYIVENSTTDNSASPVLNVGESTGDDSQRSLIKFPIPPTAGFDVHFAELVLTPDGTCPATVPMAVRHATTEWTETPGAWPGPSIAGSAWLPADPDGPSGSGPSFAFSCSAGKVRGQITPIVDDWVRGVTPNHGLILSAIDEEDPSQMRTFSSNQATTSTDRPYVDLLYTFDDPSGPNTPSHLSPTGPLTTLNPTLIARYSHPGIPPTAGGLFFEMREATSRMSLGYAQFNSAPNTPVILPSGLRGGIVIGGGIPAGYQFDWRATAFNTAGTPSTTRWSAASPWVSIRTPASAAGCTSSVDLGEQSDTRANAAPWNGTTALSRLICNDPDVYELITDGDPDLRVTLSVDGDADLDMAVYGPAGPATVYDSTATTEEHVVADAGTYYVEVYGYRGASGTYTLDGEAMLP